MLAVKANGTEINADSALLHCRDAERSVVMWTGGVRVIILDDENGMLMVKQHHEDHDLSLIHISLHNMPFEVTPETVAAALKAADAYGRYYLGE